MTVSTISFISSNPVSLLQPNSIWVQIIISKEVSSENVGLLCSRSMSQPRLKVSVNVCLDGILCIAKSFVTKPSMVRHHYKPECHNICKKWVSTFKVKVTVTEFWFTQWNITISVICSELLIYLFFGAQLSLTVHIHKLECLVKRLLCCIQGQGHSAGSELQWMFARTISLIGQT